MMAGWIGRELDTLRIHGMVGREEEEGGIAFEMDMMV